jgi:hypothetical protein
VNEVSRVYNNKYRDEHREKVSEYTKIYDKKYYEENKEKISKRNNIWRKTSLKGREIRRRELSKRRNLGHKPINEYFKGADAHHLRYSNNHEEQDNDITIYVPNKLHRSIQHNGNTGQNMKEINVLLLEWYLNSTPTEERNPKAVKLYWNYCTLPEPTWAAI